MTAGNLAAKTMAKEIVNRQYWMAVLARATADDLAAIFDRHGDVPAPTVLKVPETGTVMIEARAGGSGRRFNAGEASVTRCVVQFPSGALGVCYALGADRRKARLAAILDGLLQDRSWHARLAPDIERLAALQSAARELASRKAAATKVDFFTLVRGHD
jgi:alpha-D-ribose 1-methylphosphonate 5-triphosphate synthase subunit PhnG